MDEIKPVDPAKADLSFYQKQLADCVVLTADNRFYMQLRPEGQGICPGAVCLFGGHVESGETPVQAVIRELGEETGAQIKTAELVSVGAVTEGWTGHMEIVHVYFWHDRESTITGCYEADPIVFDSMEDALVHPKLMAYARWALLECKNRGFFPEK